MGMTAGGGARKGGRGRRGAPRYAAMADINMTPFIDVMLVLLIIFMVAAPLLATGVPIDLPKSQAKALQQDNKPLTVSVKDGGQVYLQDSEIKIEDLIPKLKAIIEARGAMRTKSGETYDNHYCLLYRLEAGMIVRNDQFDAAQTATDEAVEECAPMDLRFGQRHRHPKHPPFAVGGDADGHQDGAIDQAAGLTHAFVAGVEKNIGGFAKRSFPPGGQAGIELFGGPTDLGG